MRAIHSPDRETVTLNIGLENNPIWAEKSATLIAGAMATWLAENQQASGIREDTIVRACIVDPKRDRTNATERCAVVEYSAEDVSTALLAKALAKLCDTLTQDCIAVWIDHDEGNEPSKGFLAGPGSLKYEPFDPSCFEIGDANAGLWAYSAPVESVQ